VGSRSVSAAENEQEHSESCDENGEILVDVTNIEHLKGKKCYVLHVVGRAKKASAVATCVVIRTRVPQSWSLGDSPRSRAGCVEVKNLVVSSNVDPSQVKFSPGGYCMDDKKKDFASLKAAILAYSTKRRRIFFCQSILKEMSMSESFEERLVDEGDLSNGDSEDLCF